MQAQTDSTGLSSARRQARRLAPYTTPLSATPPSTTLRGLIISVLLVFVVTGVVSQPPAGVLAQAAPGRPSAGARFAQPARLGSAADPENQILQADPVPYLVADIALDTQSAEPYGLEMVGDTLFFAADDGVHGHELWKSAGSPPVTTLVRDLWPGYPSSQLLNLTAFQGALFFTADDGLSGQALWKSDGTPEGTILVKLLPQSPTASLPGNFTPAGQTLFFSVNGTDLWKSDGTPDGTVLVMSDLRSYTNLVPFGGRIFFGCVWPGAGLELCASDGTPAGTVLVKDIAPGETSSDPGWPVAAGAALFFTANDRIHGPELWVSDGTPAGTRLVEDTDPSTISGPDRLAAYNNLVLFNGVDNGLWRSDGSPEGTFPIAAHLEMSSAAEMGGLLYIGSSAGLWRSDGTGSGTFPVRDALNISQLTPAGEKLYFVNNNPLTEGSELWASDGTQAGTALVKDVYPGQCGAFPCSSNPWDLTGSAGGRLFFEAEDGRHGRELWTTVGTPESTVLVQDINLSTTGSGPDSLTPVGDKLFFRAADAGDDQDLLGHGQELWVSDGAPGGARLVKDIYPGVFSSSLDRLVGGPHGTLFFTASDGVNGFELWRSDGTSAGTRMVTELTPGPDGEQPAWLTPVGDALFFVMTNNRTFTRDLWRTDGTPEGTVRLKEVSNPYCLTAVGGTLYFITPFALWKSDGTPEGTVQVKDVSAACDLTGFAGALYFVGGDGEHGYELWRSDGTPEGTVLVKDISPGAASSQITRLVPALGALYFAADDGGAPFNPGHGRELWVSDGTPEGTRLFADIYPGPRSSDPYELVEANGQLFFGADTPEAGIELMVTGPDPASLGLALDIDPGPGPLASGRPSGLTSAGDRIYFAASSPDYGSELWASDGAPGGTRLVTDLRPGPLDGFPQYFSLWRDPHALLLFFAADDGVHGRELWAARLLEFNAWSYLPLVFRAGP